MVNSLRGLLRRTLTAFLLLVSVSLGGCAGMAFTERQGRDIGQSVGGITGGVAGAAIQNSLSGTRGLTGIERYVGPAAGAVAGARLGGAAGEAAAANAGRCDVRQTVTTRNGVTSITEVHDCQQRGPITSQQPLPGRF
jgi:hypothetical protein